MNVSHCLSTGWLGFNSRQLRSVSRDYEWSHMLPCTQACENLRPKTTVKTVAKSEWCPLENGLLSHDDQRTGRTKSNGMGWDGAWLEELQSTMDQLGLQGVKNNIILKLRWNNLMVNCFISQWHSIINRCRNALDWGTPSRRRPDLDAHYQDKSHTNFEPWSKVHWHEDGLNRNNKTEALQN